MSFENKEDYLRILEKPAIDCEDIEILYGDYLEGDLPESLSQRLKEHYVGCVTCQEFVSSYLLVIELAKALKPEPDPIPEDVQQRLRDNLSKRLNIRF